MDGSVPLRPNMEVRLIIGSAEASAAHKTPRQPTGPLMFPPARWLQRHNKRIVKNGVSTRNRRSTCGSSDYASDVFGQLLLSIPFTNSMCQLDVLLLYLNELGQDSLPLLAHKISQDTWFGVFGYYSESNNGPLCMVYALKSYISKIVVCWGTLGKMSWLNSCMIDTQHHQFIFFSSLQPYIVQPWQDFCAVPTC